MSATVRDARRTLSVQRGQPSADTRMVFSIIEKMALECDFSDV